MSEPPVFMATMWEPQRSSRKTYKLCILSYIISHIVFFVCPLPHYVKFQSTDNSTKPCQTTQFGKHHMLFFFFKFIFFISQISTFQKYLHTLRTTHCHPQLPTTSNLPAANELVTSHFARCSSDFASTSQPQVLAEELCDAAAPEARKRHR